jgi:carbohydrate diacid regulator
MREATKRTVGVIDTEGIVVACTDLANIGAELGVMPIPYDETVDNVIKVRGKTLKPIGGEVDKFDCAVFAEGEDDYARTLCVMASIAVAEAKLHFEENNDRSTFIKNIISDNILPGDIYVHANELRFEMETPRAVLLIRQLETPDLSAVSLLRDMFPDKQNEFVIPINVSDIVLVTGLPTEDEENEYLVQLANDIELRINNEIGVKTVIGVGTPAESLRELANKYKEAQVAIEVGKVFDTEKTIIYYEKLGIGRLIYQLPTTLCKMFLSEVFRRNPIESLDAETLYTINKFFENNLNVSETSRKLFVHRNTLVYRLEKIKKITGLDLRELDHTIVFKVALMVKKYLNSQGTYLE